MKTKYKILTLVVLGITFVSAAFGASYLYPSLHPDERLPNAKELEPKPQEKKTIPVQNSNFKVQYDITGGEIIRIEKAVGIQSLIIQIATYADGKLTITIPRDLIDAKISDEIDDLFFVIVDGEEVFYSEEKSTMNRTLIIPLVKGNQEIEILGTFPA